MSNNGTFIVDGVVHGYNWLQENYRVPPAYDFAEASYGLHERMSADGYRMTKEDYLIDWQPGPLAEHVFAETDIDFAIYHAVPLDDYFHDGLIAFDKGLKFREENPNRAAVYANVNPLESQEAIEKIEYYGRELKVDGIKFYPVRYNSGRSLQLLFNDHNLLFPLFEKAREVGIRNVAVHKALPLGGTALAGYRVDDIDEAAVAFPELNFEIVHAGMAFTEETAFLMGRYPNVYANLEVTSALILIQPRRFAELLGHLMYWGSPDRIVFGTGAAFVHPQPVIEAFQKFEMPRDLVEGFGYPELTQEIKDKILGLNALNLLGLDVDELRAKQAGDRWDQRKSDGLARPWSCQDKPTQEASA